MMENEIDISLMYTHTCRVSILLLRCRWLTLSIGNIIWFIRSL